MLGLRCRRAGGARADGGADHREGESEQGATRRAQNRAALPCRSTGSRPARQRGTPRRPGAGTGPRPGPSRTGECRSAPMPGPPLRRRRSPVCVGSGSCALPPRLQVRPSSWRRGKVGRQHPARAGQPYRWRGGRPGCRCPSWSPAGPGRPVASGSGTWLSADTDRQRDKPTSGSVRLTAPKSPCGCVDGCAGSGEADRSVSVDA